MASQCKSNDTGNLDMPKRSSEVLVKRYVYIGKYLVYIGFVLSMVSVTHWGSWNIFPVDKG